LKKSIARQNLQNKAGGGMVSKISRMLLRFDVEIRTWFQSQRARDRTDVENEVVVWLNIKRLEQ
jgi:hypothetical protein